MNPWWMRPTAEGLEEENRDRSKTPASEPERAKPEPPATAPDEPRIPENPPYDRAAPITPSSAAEPTVSLDPVAPRQPVEANEPRTPESYAPPAHDPFDSYAARPAAEAESSVGTPYLEAGDGAGSGAIWTLEPLRIQTPEPNEDLVLLPPSSFAPATPSPIHEDEEDEGFDDDEEDEDEDGEEHGAASEGAEGSEEKPAEEREARRRRSRGRRGGRRRAGTRNGEPETTPRDESEPEAAPEAPEPPRGRRAPQSSLLHHAPAAPAAPAAPVTPQPRIARSGESFSIPASDFESFSREIIISVPERARTASDERKIALFCDLENVALGVRDSEVAKFDINLVLERLLEKGKIIVKKAYADWERYSDFKRPFHEAAIELIDIPQKYYSGKNSADIKMVVDAMDLSYAKEHLDTFVLLSGDSDFSPLVSKLKENNKYVIGIGVKNSSSALLIDNCDEFIFYEDIWRDTQKGPKLDGLNKKTAEAFSLMVESIQALVRENKDVLWGSMIKQTMQRKRPSFNEGYYGYSTFSELLEDAEKKNIIKLKKDQRSGTYIVTGFSKAGEGPTSVGRR